MEDTFFLFLSEVIDSKNCVNCFLLLVQTLKLVNCAPCCSIMFSLDLIVSTLCNNIFGVRHTCSVENPFDNKKSIISLIFLRLLCWIAGCFEIIAFANSCEHCSFSERYSMKEFFPNIDWLSDLLLIELKKVISLIFHNYCKNSYFSKICTGTLTIQVLTLSMLFSWANSNLASIFFIEYFKTHKSLQISSFVIP